MELATSALGTILPKLDNLLQYKYQLPRRVWREIAFFMSELEAIHAILHRVSEAPTEQQLLEDVRIWARRLRESSYDMEDMLDTFLVRVEGPDPPSIESWESFISKVRSMLRIRNMLVDGIRLQIGKQAAVIKEQTLKQAARYDRYKVNTFNHVTSVDPHIEALYTKTTGLVGIDEARKEIIMKLREGDYVSSQQQKIISIVGCGGLGKTTLAKAVYDEIKLQFDCTAFVVVSCNPDMKKVINDILYQLGLKECRNIRNDPHDVHDLIDEFSKNICNKRYFIVIDDIWDIRNWDIIKLALPDYNTGCRIITTTRSVRVAKYIGGAYEMKPLSSDSSRILLYIRIFGNEDQGKCFNEDMVELSDRILKKCAGVPLAIITMASLIARKGINKIEWDEVYNSICRKMGLYVENMTMILSYSYYHLPSHLRVCLLYLSMFPRAFKIKKKRLIWLWIAAGFIQHQEQGKSLFEMGESYIVELINRSMIQPLYDDYHILEIDGCHVHDMVLDLILSLSSEENFIMALGDMNQTYTLTAVQRLSFQHGEVGHRSNWGIRITPKLRSFIGFSSVVGQMPSLVHFKVLRVLDLEACDLSKGYSLESLGTLFHLRYLSLRNLYILNMVHSLRCVTSS